MHLGVILIAFSFLDPYRTILEKFVSAKQQTVVGLTSCMSATPHNVDQS